MGLRVRKSVGRVAEICKRAGVGERASFRLSAWPCVCVCVSSPCCCCCLSLELKSARATQIDTDCIWKLLFMPCANCQIPKKNERRWSRWERRRRSKNEGVPRWPKNTKTFAGASKSLCTFLWHSFFLLLLLFRPFAVVSFHVQFYFDCNNFLQQHFHLAKSLLLYVLYSYNPVLVSLRPVRPPFHFF